ncbi:TPA: DUF1080 domain-containing protein [Candidatus Poribacteria bacterium]|nr:DUF1080 domain-containing protein [Candidatus Poribacteria bacterium]
MKRAHFLCILLYVSSIVITPFSLWAYEENFDTGKAEGWVDSSAGKSWKTEKDQYHQPDAGNVNVFTCYAVNDKKWEDYTFEVQIKPISVSNYAGVLFRVKDAGAGGTSWATGDFLYWLIGIGGSYSKLWDAPAGAAVHDTPGDTLKSGEWNDVKVVAEGNDFIMFLNGKEQKRYTDKSGGHDFGGIGLATYNADAFFDNVKVDGPGIPGAAVESTGKIATTWAQIKDVR